MNLQSQLFFGVLVFLLGLAAGVLIFWLTRDEEQKSREEAKKPEVSSFARPPAGGAVKLATIWREESGRILVQAQDGSLLEPEALQEILGVAWPSVTPLDQPTQLNQPLPPASMPDRNPIIPQTLEGISQPLTYQHIEPVSTNAVESISRAFQKPRPPVARSLAQQINDILQDRIAGTELARRGLRLVDLPNQELGVEIDLHTYPGIEQVPDPAASQAIREAAKEWQEKHR